MPTLNQLKSCFYGLAFGDAIAKETEFLDVETILRQWPPNGPTDLPQPIAYVTDDTQMALAIADAILAARPHGPLTSATVEPYIREAFLAWYHSPDNNRAPGMTCLGACEALEQPIRWQDACAINSKGCGANMRVAPIAMIDSNWFAQPSDRAALAQFQAALTHGHATALAASDLTVYALEHLFNQQSPLTLVPRLIDYAASQRLVYHGDWLGDLWARSPLSSPEEYMAQGWDDCIQVLHALQTALTTYTPGEDPCRYTGEGWIAEEALATGLLCFLLYADSPQDMLNRAAVTCGDSDSIACLAGAFAGAYHSASIWSSAWYSRIEYAAHIDLVCDTLALSSSATK